jgi:hypothetical protein
MNKRRVLRFVTALMLTGFALATPARLRADWCHWQYFWYASEFFDENGEPSGSCWLEPWQSCDEPLHCFGDTSGRPGTYEYGRCQICESEALNSE